MKFIYFFFFFLFLNSLSAFEVNVRFFDEIEQKSDANLQVLVRETKQVYQTDNNGYVKIEIPNQGSYTFRLIKLTGFKDYKVRIAVNQPSLNVNTGKRLTGGINITGQKKKTVISRHKVTYEEIKRIPGSFGEALKGVETLPGINPAFGGFSNVGDPIVRGAAPSSNVYTYDGLPIFFAFHLDGLSSVVNNDLIKSIDVYTGVFPASSDNVLGGLIEIESPDKPKKNTGNFRTGFWSSAASYRAGFDKLYISVGVKKGYLNNTIGRIAAASLPRGERIRLPNFLNSQLRIAYELAPNHQISFVNLAANDSFYYSSSARPFSNDPQDDNTFNGSKISFQREFSTTAIQYNWTPSKKFNNRMSFIKYTPLSFFYGNFGYLSANAKTSIGYDSLKNDLNWKVFSFLDIDAGFDYRMLDYKVDGTEVVLKDPDNLNPNPYKIKDPDFVSVDKTEKDRSLFLKSYISFNFNIGNLKFEPGVRYNTFDYTKQSSLSPRANLSYIFPKVGKGLTLFAAAGKQVGFPTDALAKVNKKNGNPNLKFEKVNKATGGFEQKVTNNTLFKIELFNNYFYDLITDDPYATTYIGVNPIRYEHNKYYLVRNKRLLYSNKGTGTSRGYEILIRKTTKPSKINDWFGWISYTWSKTMRNPHTYQRYTGEIYDRIMPVQFTNKYNWSGLERLILGNFFDNSLNKLYEYDRTHIINLIYGWKFKRVWQFGARWTYLTQNPYRPIINAEKSFENDFNKQAFFREIYAEDPFYPSTLRQKRMKPFHKLDLRLDKFYNYEWGYINFYFSVLNVYFRKNLEPTEDFNEQFPYSLTNPKPQPYTYNSINKYLPYIQVGLETRF